MRHILTLLIGLFLLPLPAQALDMAAKRPVDGGPLEPGQLYLVRYKCAKSPNGAGKAYDLDGYLGRLTSIYRQGRNPFAKVTAVAHGVLIGRKSAGLDAAGKLDLALSADKFPEAQGLPIHVYAVAKGSGGEARLDNRSCDGVFVVSGSDAYEARPVFRYSLNGDDGLLARTASLVLTSVSPAISLFSGKPIAEKTAEQIRGASQLVDNYRSYLAMFREDGSASETLPLRVGRLRIGTFASNVDIDVRPIRSLLTDCEENGKEGCVNFPGVLDDLMRGKPLLSPDFAAAGSLHDQCVKLELALRRSGILADTDVAYTLFQAAAASFTDKNRIIECLRPAYARNAAENARLYRLATREQRLTIEDVEAWQRRIEREQAAAELARTQPVMDQALMKTVDQFVRKAGRYACNSRLTARDRQELKEMVAASLTLADDTEELAIVGRDAEQDELSGSFTEIMDRLRAGGFERYGCYSITRDNEKLQRWYDGAEVMLLMFRSRCGEATAREADALGLRLFFDERRIARLVVTEKWVPDMLAANKACAPARPVESSRAIAAAAKPEPKAGAARSEAKTIAAAPANDNAPTTDAISPGDLASATATSKAVGVPEITGSITPLMPSGPGELLDALVGPAM